MADRRPEDEEPEDRPADGSYGDLNTDPDHPRDEDGYKVGKGRPPLHTRFKPGQSGNPGGRPRKPITYVELFSKVAAELTVGRGPNGERMEVSWMEAALRAQFLKAAKGDNAAFRNLIRDAKLAASVGDREMSSQEAFSYWLSTLPPDERAKQWAAIDNAVEMLREYGSYGNQDS